MNKRQTQKENSAELSEHSGYLRGLRMAASILAYVQAFSTDKKSKDLLDSLRTAFHQAAEKHLAENKATWPCPNPSCSVIVGSYPIPHHTNTCPRCGTLKRI